MKLYVLFGQRKERYPGEYGPEALACFTEYDYDGNPDYLPSEKEKHDNTGDFENTCIVELVVHTPSLMRLIRPVSKSILCSITQK